MGTWVAVAVGVGEAVGVGVSVGGTLVVVGVDVGVSVLGIRVAVAVAAPIGDLFESFVKRDVGVKDTSAIFGAHGGALDRLDAALFAIVAGYYVWQGLL